MSIPSPFVQSWQQMIEYNAEYFVKQTERIIYDRATASYHSFARNMLVEHMKGDWLLQMDTDITFDPDILVRMLYKMNFHNIDVMVAPYLYKSDPHPPVMYGWNPKTKKKFILAGWDKNEDLVRIQGSGAGCLLVRKKVFDKIRTKLKCSPFDIYTDKDGSPLSEDHSFFERCQKLRIPVYFSPTISVRHLIYKELDIDKDFTMPKEVEKIEGTGFGVRLTRTKS